MDTLVLQFEKQKHFPFLLPARDFFLYKRENLTKWKHKQLTMWNLTLISISLCFFSVSFSLPYCKKLSSTMNFNQSWLVCFLVLEKKIIHGPLPSISQTFMGHVAGHWDRSEDCSRVLVLANVSTQGVPWNRFLEEWMNRAWTFPSKALTWRGDRLVNKSS